LLTPVAWLTPHGPRPLVHGDLLEAAVELLLFGSIAGLPGGAISRKRTRMATSSGRQCPGAERPFATAATPNLKPLFGVDPAQLLVI
jgi:hypothetical protein